MQYKTKSKAQPTKMHKVINEILKSDGLNFHITQNIDGLHKDENIASEKIIELHGNIFQAECLSCKKSFNTESFYESVVKTKVILFALMQKRFCESRHNFFWAKSKSFCFKSSKVCGRKL
ncbi:MAG: hypothetical protein CM15mP12_3480 [Gammaproteobacteria bacterium]|nr:MAG: hypothetical protein CM15mP12_3480 [Gammaproteobacteria bacterium]